MMFLLTEQTWANWFFFRVEDEGCGGLVPVLQHD